MPHSVLEVRCDVSFHSGSTYPAVAGYCCWSGMCHHWENMEVGLPAVEGVLMKTFKGGIESLCEIKSFQPQKCG